MAALLSWRNWRLPVKLTAITVVPVLLAFALGVLTVQTQTRRAAAFERSDRLVVLGDEVLTLVTGLQAEREAVAGQLATRRAADPVALRSRREAVDAGLIVFHRAGARLLQPSEAVLARLAAAERLVQRLAPLRGQVTGPGLDAVSAVAGYGAIVDGLLELDRALASDVAAAELSRTATALHDLAEVADQLSREHSLVWVAAVRGSMSAAELAALRAAEVRLADRRDAFAAAASPAQLDDYQRSVAGPGVDVRDQWVQRMIAGSEPAAPGAAAPGTGGHGDAGSGGAAPGSAGGSAAGAGIAVPAAADWDAASGSAMGLTAQVARRIRGPLLRDSGGLQDRASDQAGQVSVVLLAAVVLAVAVGVVITRQLIGSLGVLRRTALQVAEEGLPAAVAAIRSGGRPDAHTVPVPLACTEELGQLARAFDAVHRQALRLAADEAALRAGFGGVIANLSRRSQSLVQRLLHLLERLERDEEDADQLAMLFRLDHLATRMRRNNENLMVLSGSDVLRRSAEPTPLADLLRAAISEIEHYQRVELRSTPRLQVAGHAAGDLVRLIAELLDNATEFSPPDSPVSVAAHRSDSGALVVNVLDQGIGMSDAEVADANARLRGAGPVELPQSRRMGLFVVARLAGRHSFEVRLHGGQDLQGVQATVTVAADLVIEAPADAGDPLPMTGDLPAADPADLADGGGHETAVARWERAGHGAEPANAWASANGHSRDDRGSEDGGPDRDGEAGVAAAGAVDDRGRPGGIAVNPFLPMTRAGAAGAAGAGPAGRVENGDGHRDPPRRTGELPHRIVDGGWLPAQGTATTGFGNGSGPADPPPAAEPEVSTPIFDQMASAWFAAAQPAGLPVWPDAGPGGDDEPAGPGGEPASGDTPAAEVSGDGVSGDGVPGGDDSPYGVGRQPVDLPEEGDPSPDAERVAATWDPRWHSAADDGWVAVRAVSAAKPGQYTAAGLPRRTPRQSLLPGSVAVPGTSTNGVPSSGAGPTSAGSSATGPSSTGRDAVDVRTRLSSLHAGLARGRNGATEPHAHPAPAGGRPALRGADAGTPTPAGADGEQRGSEQPWASGE